MNRWAKFFLSMGLLGLLCSATVARADTFETYSLAWSGATFSNSAIATGTMTLDLTTLPANVSSSPVEIISDITSLSITVTDASAGNGTFTLADLLTGSSPYTYWSTGGYTFNMYGDVDAQLRADVGDFNLFFPYPGPTGVDRQLLGTNGNDGGDDMFLTEFQPVGAPEPDTASLTLLGVGMLGLLGLGVRAKG
jgi:hypothetical protein